ncbi:MAG: hypothetical protein KGZ56_08740 [Dethiobacter sp.]|nr:hypothetical protein [Dethiobacter sp.]
MKIFLFLLITTFVLIGPAGCVQNELPHQETGGVITNMGSQKKDILVEVDIQWKTASELVITYTNKTEHPFIYGPIHTLQKLRDNQWIDILPKYPIAYRDVALILEPGSAFSETIDLITLYGDLEKGNYRIIKRMQEDRMDELTGRLSEDKLQVDIVAEFQI